MVSPSEGPLPGQLIRVLCRSCSQDHVVEAAAILPPGETIPCLSCGESIFVPCLGIIEEKVSAPADASGSEQVGMDRTRLEDTLPSSDPIWRDAAAPEPPAPGEAPSRGEGTRGERGAASPSTVTCPHCLREFALESVLPPRQTTDTDAAASSRSQGMAGARQARAAADERQDDTTPMTAKADIPSVPDMLTGIASRHAPPAPPSSGHAPAPAAEMRAETASRHAPPAPPSPGHAPAPAAEMRAETASRHAPPAPSSPGTASTSSPSGFSVRMPPPAPQSADRRDTRPAGLPSGARTILLVEDTEFFQEILRAALAGRHHTISATTAPAALEILRRERIDLMVLDLGLERETDGVEVLDAAARSGLPTLIFTARNEADLWGDGWEELRSRGATDLLLKGLNIEEQLLIKIERILSAAVS